MSIIEDIEGMNLFRNKDKSILVHGDLIIHNILTDGRNLTGVLDWELALYGDPDYDLCRLFYYQECAKAYQEQWVDETFESYYMDKLMNAILESSLIKDTELFKKKYYFMRAIFYLNALYWSINSSDPEKNISELIGNWNQKTGLSI
ncbi:phosphotransferase [Candidatus Azambacteria bacterium]|nr:phosphotransferase [Candidatus Azambacteria bacterium]